MNLKVFFRYGLVLATMISYQVSHAQNSELETSIKMFRVLAESYSNQNFIFSPYAMQSALGMVSLGAKGRTQKQLGKGISNWPTKPNPAYKLFLANRLWVHLSYPLDNAYVGLQEKTYDVRPWMVDFSKAPDFVRDRINGWVSEKTQGKIKHIVTEDSFDPSMKMMLTNVIYFKGEWVYPFDPSETRQERFLSDLNEESSKGADPLVWMMKQNRSFNYVKLKDAQILEIPYLDGEIALIMILPNIEYGRISLEKSLRADIFEKWIAQMSLHSVQVSLPKFAFNLNFDMKESLKKIGVKDVFTPGVADFSGMNRGKELVLSSWIHQSAMTVNEEGTEALSIPITAQRRVVASMSTHEAISEDAFQANHPFVFFVYHRGSHSILFAGHYIHP